MTYSMLNINYLVRFFQFAHITPCGGGHCVFDLVYVYGGSVYGHMMVNKMLRV